MALQLGQTTPIADFKEIAERRSPLRSRECRRFGSCGISVIIPDLFPFRNWLGCSL